MLDKAIFDAFYCFFFFDALKICKKSIQQLIWKTLQQKLFERKT